MKPSVETYAEASLEPQTRGILTHLPDFYIPVRLWTPHSGPTNIFIVPVSDWTEVRICGARLRRGGPSNLRYGLVALLELKVYL